jgi:ABC-2 type transport system permease protein
VSIRPIAGLVLRQYYLFRSSPARLLPIFAWVAIDIVLWGFIARYLNQVSHNGLDFIGQLLGAVLFLDFFTRVMQGVTTAFFEDVWSRNFLNLFASSLTLRQYISALVITSIATSLIGMAAMLLIATSVFGLTLTTSLLSLSLTLLVLFVFGTALGVLACALVLRLGPASEWLVWPIPAILSPFAGVFYPLDTLHEWMRVVGKLMPPSYVFESLRAQLKGQPSDMHALLWAAGLALVQLLVCVWIFTRVHKLAVKSGLLARYSAEAVS